MTRLQQPSRSYDSTQDQASRRAAYLQVGRCGRVWRARWPGHPENTGQTVDEFSQSPPDEDTCVARMMGTPGNAPLVVGLCQAGVAVEVCTPLAVSVAGRRNNPRTALPDLARWPSSAPSLGGWHRVSADLDLPSYQLAVACQSGADEVTLADLVLFHPAVRAWEFVAGLDHAWCARLVGAVCDPRWYVDLARPDSPSKFHAFLGLHPKNFRSIFGDGRPFYRYDLACTVLSAWSGGLDVPDGPRAFLRRVETAARFPGAAAYRASQRFADFVRLTWLQALSPAVDLFDPGLFFRRPDEAAAFKEWVSQP